MRTINDVGTGGLLPDATVLLAVTAEQAAARRDPGAADRIEREPIAFHRGVIAAYEDVLAAGNGRLVRVDGTGEAERHRRARARGARAVSAADPFEGLVGNEAARERLRIALRQPGHAYLLLGRPGYGVDAHARRFAAALAGLPERALESGHPDLLEVRPEGTQIRIDQVRELWRDIQLRPFSAERRVYLIWDAETMPEVVQHALLKSIEEPPGHAVVILVCAQPHRLLATVRSRCEQVRFAPLAAAEVATALGLGGPAGLALARASGGDLERARELIEGGEASDRRERYLALARSVYADERLRPRRGRARAWPRPAARAAPRRARPPTRRRRCASRRSATTRRAPRPRACAARARRWPSGGRARPRSRRRARPSRRSSPGTATCSPRRSAPTTRWYTRTTASRSQKMLQTVAKHLPRAASRPRATRAERWS